MADKTEKKVDVKSTKKNKPSFFSKIAAWFRSLKSEIKKIVWTSPKTVLKNFVLVAITVVVMSAVIGLLDFLFGQALNALVLIFA